MGKKKKPEETVSGGPPANRPKPNSGKAIGVGVL